MRLSGPLLLLLLLQLLASLPKGLRGCLQCDNKFKENLANLRTDLVQRQIHDSRLKARAEALLKGLEGDFFPHYATSQFAGFAGTQGHAALSRLSADVRYPWSCSARAVPPATDTAGSLQIQDTTWAWRPSSQPHHSCCCFPNTTRRQKASPLNFLNCIILCNSLPHVEQAAAPSISCPLSPDQALLDELVEFRKKTTMKLKEALKEHQMKACDKSICDWLRYSVLDCVVCKDAYSVCYTIHQCFVDSQDRLSLRYGPVLWDPNIAQNGVAIVLCMGGILFLVIVGVVLTYWRNRLYLYV